MKKLFLSLFVFPLVFILCLFLGEQYFKKKFKPGYQTHYSGFDIVDSLVVYEDYQTDVFGNYVLSSVVRDTLKLLYNQTNCSFSDSHTEKSIASVDGIKQILADFCMLKQNSKTQYPFEQYFQQLSAQSTWTKSDSAILQYVEFPFNSQGFRSIEVENYPSEKIKIMFIGDSFAWGMSAKPYYNSFIDLLLAKDYQVFNFGIPSVDPIQYYSLCKSYLDSIQPDLVLINFYEGNDFMNSKRIHAENIPHEHITNAGFFESSPEGIYLNPAEAYAYYAQLMRIPENSLINQFLGKTAIGSLIWTQTHPKTRYHYTANLDKEKSITYTKSYIDSIGLFLDTKEVNYFFLITPEEAAAYNQKQETIRFNVAAIEQTFTNLEYYIPHNLKHEDYNQPKDIHFNNLGSLKFANFIDSIIKIKLNVE